MKSRTRSKKKYSFKGMLARGWGRSVIYQGKEIIAIQPPNQKLTTKKEKE